MDELISTVSKILGGPLIPEEECLISERITECFIRSTTLKIGSQSSKDRLVQEMADLVRAVRIRYLLPSVYEEEIKRLPFADRERVGQWYLSGPTGEVDKNGNLTGKLLTPLSLDPEFDYHPSPDDVLTKGMATYCGQQLLISGYRNSLNGRPISIASFTQFAQLRITSGHCYGGYGFAIRRIGV